MFEASVDGQPYDAERWGAYYKPYGVNVPEGATRAAEPAATVAATPATASAPFDADEEDEVLAATAPVQAPVAEAKPSSQRAEDILAMIRKRKEG